MVYLTSKKFDFRSSALPADAFGVVHFKGFEGFSRLYEFEIMLVSNDPEIDLTEVLQNPAVFTILRDEGDIPFNGILARFEQLHAVGEHVFYRAVLVPKFWWLSLTHHNQVFLDKTIPDILAGVLEDGGLTRNDYELRLQRDYPQWEFVCQYRESHLNFVSRWMEREGMYYFFEQAENGEKLIITDTKLSHTPMAEGQTMYYSPPSALEEVHREEVIGAFICRQEPLPGKLHVNDYNYRTPSLSLSAEAEVSARGRGEVHLYGEHFRTPAEGQALAQIRAEELRSREKRFHGESTIPFLRPGYLFELQDHYRSGFNRQYLTIELAHEGSQTAFLLAGIQKGLAEVEKHPYYRNGFVAIASDVQFRHAKTCEKPYFFGTINARIDAEGSGEYAELDDQGRYKVRLPFDVNDAHKDGKASHWLRMAQPYAGTDHGMHFPLHKGTEVLLTFVEGDPDRPIIAGAVPNPAATSPVTSANQSESVIQTAADNKIRIEDLAGKERIIMQTPAANSWIRLGTPNDPPEYVRDWQPGAGIKISSFGKLVEKSKGRQKVRLRPKVPYDELDQFELTGDFDPNNGPPYSGAYETIRQDIIKENEHIQKNIDLIGELRNEWPLPKDPQKYTEEETRLSNLKISSAEIDSILDYLKTNTFNSKSDFIEHVSGQNFNPSGVTNWESTNPNYPGKKDVVVSCILRNTFNKHAKHRKIEVSGDQISETDGSLKINALTEDDRHKCRLEMTDQGIFIDAGKDRDLTLKCRKLFVKNEDEDNITYGDDFTVHYGSNEEYFYGNSIEYFYGEKNETMRGKAHETFEGDKYEEHHGTATERFYGLKDELHHGRVHSYFLGGAMEYSLAGKFSIDTGESLEISGFPFKQEIVISAILEAFLGVKFTIGAGAEIKLLGPVELEREGLKLKKSDTVLENKMAQIATDTLALNFCNLKIDA